MITATATFCATLVDQWARLGSTDAFIAPGSRSTPLALELVADDRFRTHLFLDERSASFACLGHGLATGRPAVVLCTSGTAATHFHGAVVEADASGVPMLVCTADRPPELWGIGAPQTIDQTDLFGSAVRGFLEPGPPDDPHTDPTTWRTLATDAWSAAAGTAGQRAGPVHLNLSFRDPLVGQPGQLPATPAPDEPAGTEASLPVPPEHGIPQPSPLQHHLPERGVIVVGRSEADPELVFSLAEATGWPVLADSRSRCRRPGSVQRFDHLLRSSTFATSMRPDMILRIGEPPASKVLGQWIADSVTDGADVIALTDRGRVIDPERVAVAVLPIAETLPRIVGAATSDQTPAEPFDRHWLRAQDVVEEVIDRLLSSTTDTEPGVARRITTELEAGSNLVVSSSMPVRDVEWYGVARDDIAVYANRGANGIDGVTSTAIGVAMAGRPTTLLTGDVAFLHDTNALIALRDRAADLTIVVINNDGGGIFSFLPQNQVLPHDDYEFLFGTPHGTDLETLCHAHGIDVEPWTPGALNQEGIRVLLARTDRKQNRLLHDRLVAAAVEALDSTVS